MINRPETSRALAKAIACKDCGKHAEAAQWARQLVLLLECAEILEIHNAAQSEIVKLGPLPQTYNGFLNALDTMRQDIVFKADRENRPMPYAIDLSRHEIELLVTALTQFIVGLQRAGATAAELKAVSNRIDELEALGAKE